MRQAAETQRRVGSTQSNDRSSRSHLVCTISVDTWHRPSSLEQLEAPPHAADGSHTGSHASEPSVSELEDNEPNGDEPNADYDPGILHTCTLQLVDLAGSERCVAPTPSATRSGAHSNRRD